MANPEISVQLYSIHRELDEDLDGSLDKLAEIGLRTVEAFNFVTQAKRLKSAFDARGLSAPTGHAILIEDAGVETPDKLLSVPPPEETFAAAAELGVQTVIDPFVAPDRWQTADDVKRNADRLNERSQQAQEFGLAVGYHNHDHEFTSRIDGRSALEAFADRLDPAVKLEIDLYWATAGGAELVSLLQGLGDRVIAVHAKDGPVQPGVTSASNLPKDQQPAGTGDVPLEAVLTAGLPFQYAVIEFDHYEGDTFAGIAQSYAYLSKTLGR